MPMGMVEGSESALDKDADAAAENAGGSRTLRLYLERTLAAASATMDASSPSEGLSVLLL
ncbi:hypothetical protein BKG87_15815 [Mycobacteroides chelonae]|nr:hypothetical protein BKG87_15815 [Mycobacteroides chelonae]